MIRWFRSRSRLIREIKSMRVLLHVCKLEAEARERAALARERAALEAHRRTELDAAMWKQSYLDAFEHGTEQAETIDRLLRENAELRENAYE